MADPVRNFLGDDDELARMMREYEEKTVVNETEGKGGDMGQPCLHEQDWGDMRARMRSVESRVKQDEGHAKAQEAILHNMTAELKVLGERVRLYAALAGAVGAAAGSVVTTIVVKKLGG